MVERPRPVPWTAPDDPPDPILRMPVGAQFDGFFLAAFADGGVYALSRVSLDVVRGYITPAGNERVPNPASVVAPPRPRSD